LELSSDGFEMVDPEALLEEKLMLDEIAAMSQEMVPRLPVGHHGNPNQYPLGKRAGLNAQYPFLLEPLTRSGMILFASYRP